MLIFVVQRLIKTFALSTSFAYTITYESRHKISNNVVCVTSKDSDQPAHMGSLIRAFVSPLNIQCSATDQTEFGVSKHKKTVQRLGRGYTCQNATLLEISYHG